MDKFGRNYFLEVKYDDFNTVIIGLPFTIEFDITRTTLSSVNVCQIRIYNLALDTRNLLRFNAYDNTTFKYVRLRAGYGNNLATVFTGSITQAWSVREGVNYITQIECFDGGYAFNNGVTDAQFPSGTPLKVIITQLISTLPQTSIGAIGNYTDVIERGNTYSGNTVDVLKDLTGKGFFIDRGKANALQDDEYIEDPSGVNIINASSGLLGTPVLEQTTVHFDMLFEPSLNAGQRIFLDSQTSDGFFKGFYIVTGIKHRGMISESVCGNVITTADFLVLKDGKGVFSQSG